MQYVYLISAPHSGSTLIAVLLGCHKDISTVGEFATNFPSSLKCSCGVPFNMCLFWNEIKKEAKELNIDIGNLNINLGLNEDISFLEEVYYHLFRWKFVDVLRDKIYNTLFPGIQNKTMNTLEKSLKLANIILNKEKTKVFLDTTKNPFQVKFLSQHPDVELKVINLVRDGRAVTWSLINKEKWGLEKSVSTWLWSNRNNERVCKNYLSEEKVYFLKLEELCNNPKEVFKKVLYFIGVEPVLDVKSIKESGLHIIGNSMRLSFDGTIRRPDESWRKCLSSKEISYFEKKAGWLNRKLGYY